VSCIDWVAGYNYGFCDLDGGGGGSISLRGPKILFAVLDGGCACEFEHMSVLIIPVSGVVHGYWPLRTSGCGVRALFRHIYSELPDPSSRQCSTLTDVITGCESKGKAIFRESCRTSHLIRVAGCFSVSVKNCKYFVRIDCNSMQAGFSKLFLFCTL
jgi:hypothetical protein